jgi:hypothetical protein
VERKLIIPENRNELFGLGVQSHRYGCTDSYELILRGSFISKAPRPQDPALCSLTGGAWLVKSTACCIWASCERANSSVVDRDQADGPLKTEL